MSRRPPPRRSSRRRNRASFDSITSPIPAARNRNTRARLVSPEEQKQDAEDREDTDSIRVGATNQPRGMDLRTIGAFQNADTHQGRICYCDTVQTKEDQHDLRVSCSEERCDRKFH